MAGILICGDSFNMICEAIAINKFITQLFLENVLICSDIFSVDK